MTRKVLFLAGNAIPDYRIEFYEELAKRCDLTVLSRGGAGIKGAENIIDRGIKFKKINIQIQALKHVLNKKYDHIFVIGNLNFLVNAMALLFLKPERLSSWGFWKTGKLVSDRLRNFVISRGVSQVFYCNKHKQSYSDILGSTTKSVVATNTVYVDQKLVSLTKSGKGLIFVGTLNERKGIYEFLVKIAPKLRCLGFTYNIVGDGIERSKMQEFVNSHGLQETVFFHGYINDKTKLANLYNEACLEVSPNQAGLSVQRAFGNATAFITLKDAISGGEIESITQGHTGYKLSSLDEIVSKTEELLMSPDKVRMLGNNANKLYVAELTIDKMVDAFCELIAS
ncbi:glycosyltransferase [Vibrio mediterranei]|uniref:glycosyltransferase n=1 Tax=Vibrio mediterranei TaxID=689 RepID=UPI00148D70B5|nr:glycosyltransferase [Vibrio mediterranei]